MKSKNIVIFTNTLLSGGAEKQALLLAKVLNPMFNVFLIIYYGEKVEEKYNNVIIGSKIKTVKLKGTHLYKIFSFYKFLRTNRITIIFSYLLTTNLLGATIGKIAGVKERVGGIRNALLDKKKLFLQRFIHNHLSSRTIFNNYKGLYLLKEKGFNVSKAFVIPNCFELTNDYSKKEISEPVKIITVGRFVSQKGYEHAIGAMKLLKEKGVNFKYYIVGYGPLEREIRNIIDRYELECDVEIIINPHDVNDFYKISDIYLCSSLFEGLSNTILEALSFNLPIVGTMVGDNDILIKDGVNGFLVEKSEASLFVPPLLKLIGSYQLRSEMGKASYEIIQSNYSVTAFKENYLKFISAQA